MNTVTAIRADALPMNIEAEQQLIGMALLDPSILSRITMRGGAALFAEPTHARAFEVMAAKDRAGHQVDIVTVGEAMRGEECLTILGGPAYLARCAGSSISPVAAPGYIDILADLAAKRGLISAMSEAQAAIARGDTQAAQIAARLEASLIAASDVDAKRGPVSMQAAVLKALKGIVAAYNGEQTDAVLTGIGALDRIVGGFNPGELIILGGRPSMGKAQPLDAKVLTSTGWKPMGKIAIGEKLASIDGAPSLVSGIYPQGERQVYRITLSDGRTVRACGEHLWAVESSKFSGRKVWSTDQIREAIRRERYKRRLCIPLFGGEFGGGELPVDPWLLGALIGNGNLTNEVPRISTGDAGTLWRVQAAIGDEQRLRASGDYDYSISSAGGVNALTKSLRALGLMGCHSYEKFIPAEYLSASRADRLELMRGLMDTDGWVEKFGAVRYSTSSRRLADDVADLARSLGAVCSISSKEPRYTYKGDTLAGRTHFILNIRHHDPATLISLKRKARQAVRSKPVRLTIVSVEPDGFEQVQCIAVTHPDRLYVTDGYTVTHNTALALSIALNAARAGDGVAIASLEMTPDAMALRALSEATAQAGHASSYKQLRRGEIAESQFKTVRDVAQGVADLPIMFLERKFADIDALVAGCRQIKRSMGDGLKLLIIDYMQLIEARGENRTQEISRISRALKALAGALNVPVIALSQLSRAVESRDDKRPMLSDLRESGQIEQDADAVLFCYRHEYYVERANPGDDDVDKLEKWREVMEVTRNRLDIIVAKQRQGEIGTAHVRCNVALNLIWED